MLVVGSLKERESWLLLGRGNQSFPPPPGPEVSGALPFGVGQAVVSKCQDRLDLVSHRPRSRGKGSPLALSKGHSI